MLLPRTGVDLVAQSRQDLHRAAKCCLKFENHALLQLAAFYVMSITY